MGGQREKKKKDNEKRRREDLVMWLSLQNHEHHSSSRRSLYFIIILFLKPLFPSFGWMFFSLSYILLLFQNDDVIDINVALTDWCKSSSPRLNHRVMQKLLMYSRVHPSRMTTVRFNSKIRFLFSYTTLSNNWSQSISSHVYSWRRFYFKYRRRHRRSPCIFLIHKGNHLCLRVFMTVFPQRKVILFVLPLFPEVSAEICLSCHLDQSLFPVLRVHWYFGREISYISAVKESNKPVLKSDDEWLFEQKQQRWSTTS